MPSIERTRTFWDKIAPKYAKTPIKHLESYNYSLERTRSYLGREDNVLEIGAGTSSTALELAPSLGNITATDISPAMIEAGKEKAREANIQNIKFMVSDAMVKELTGPYDVVLAHNILHLIEDLPELTARVNSLLKPGGLFISKTFCTPSSFFSPTYYAMRIALPILKLLGKAPFVAFFNMEELESAIQAGGFDIIEAANGPNGDTRRYIVARKSSDTAQTEWKFS